LEVVRGQAPVNVAQDLEGYLIEVGQYTQMPSNISTTPVSQTALTGSK